MQGNNDSMGLFALLAEGSDELVKIIALPAAEFSIGQKSIPEPRFGVHRIQADESHVSVGIRNIRIGDPGLDTEEVLFEELEPFFLGVSPIPAVVVVPGQRCHLENRPLQRAKDPACFDELHLGSVVDHVAGYQNHRFVVIFSPLSDDIAYELEGLILAAVL